MKIIDFEAERQKRSSKVQAPAVPPPAVLQNRTSTHKRELSEPPMGVEANFHREASSFVFVGFRPTPAVFAVLNVSTLPPEFPPDPPPLWPTQAA
jgi:hypothetical protein